MPLLCLIIIVQLESARSGIGICTRQQVLDGSVKPQSLPNKMEHDTGVVKLNELYQTAQNDIKVTLYKYYYNHMTSLNWFTLTASIQ